MTLARFLMQGLISAAVLTLAAAVFAQGPLDHTLLGKMHIDSWTTYHGDYSGRHFSTLKQIDHSNVKALSLASVFRANTAKVGAMIGGEGPENAPTGANTTIKAIPLMVKGILYFSTPDHAWAVDARTVEWPGRIRQKWARRVCWQPREDYSLGATVRGTSSRSIQRMAIRCGGQVWETHRMPQ